ncbi:conserved hypothetical protein [Candida tropicalis MYA-3404]|uniref:Uncharacterized protein n=1 Tax=Candida tropicalis (strain ATCC MYA-3404 / T1) TaxID=294747 RepID=C5M3V0_CANTT|nr:conserved hypothetical protein [Candida tropicalis MYA-3404]EER35999.1 conserved hypothetical protein [Candida tropicalis MYA-3404]KAG4410118.1 hypothetical protein JTP64_000756 [Candida tropicalis]
MTGFDSGRCCKKSSSRSISSFSSSFNLLFRRSTLLTYFLYSSLVILRMACVANRNMFLICVSLLSLKPDFCPVNPWTPKSTNSETVLVHVNTGKYPSCVAAVSIKLLSDRDLPNLSHSTTNTLLVSTWSFSAQRVGSTQIPPLPDPSWFL